MAARLLLAVAGGLLLTASFEPLALPFLLPFAIAAFALATADLPVRRAGVVGLGFGVAFYFTHMYWMKESIGTDAWIALSGVESLFYGVIGISALLELEGTARSTHANMGTDAFGIADALPDLVDHVCPLPSMRHDLSPINGRLETMPPALLIAAESEILRCDNERLHAALLAHNRSSRLALWTHQVHAFPALFGFLPDSRAAFDLMVRFVAERLTAPGEAGETRREVS